MARSPRRRRSSAGTGSGRSTRSKRRSSGPSSAPATGGRGCGRSWRSARTPRPRTSARRTPRRSGSARSGSPKRSKPATARTPDDTDGKGGGMDARRTAEVVWRMHSARLVASLTRLVQDLALAEEVAQDAFVAALEQWPQKGVPDDPAAWLMTVGRRRAIDLIRRERSRDEKYAELAAELPTLGSAAGDEDLLSLIFVACHPILPQQSRAGLTLRVIGGLTTDEIARAFLVPSATVGQRISRAKRTLAEAEVPFALPDADELPARLSAVLEVIYLIFNEGYAATSGDDWIRKDLTEQAMRLGRMLAGLMPREPEVHGLVALMALQASRFAARTGPD